MLKVNAMNRQYKILVSFFIIIFCSSFSLNCQISELSATYYRDLLLREPDEEIEVLGCDKPYEHRLDYPTILYNGNEFIMYYRAINPKSVPSQIWCYAISTDGIIWTKPDLGIIEYDGNTNNNIISKFFGGNVEYHNGVYYLLSDRSYTNKGVVKKILELYTSTDGVYFTKVNTFSVPFFCDTQNQILWDNDTKSFKIYLRSWYKSENTQIVYNHKPYYRSVSFCETLFPKILNISPSNKPLYLSGPNVAAALNKELPIVIKNESNDDYDIYNPSVHKYLSDLYIAYPTLYYHYKNKKNGGKYDNDGVGTIGFYISDDGINFTLVKEDYIKNGNTWIEFAIGHIETETRIIHYYIKFDGTHGTHSGRNSIIARIHNKT